MATPMTASQFVKALKDEGVKVSERHSGWRTHNRNHMGSWGGVNGVVIHHTAGRDSESLCYRGTNALPGPLCHTYMDKDGVAVMMSAGRANHAGGFAANAHSAVVNERSSHPRPDASEPVDGNRHYYGIEVENLGNGTDPYPTKQYEAVVKWAAAICRFHGWSADSVIGHKEGTRRKIDPRGPVGSKDGADFSMGRFRRDVQARLDGAKPKPKPTKPVVDLSKLISAARRNPSQPGTPVTYSGTKVVEKALVAEGYLAKSLADGHYGSATVTAYAKWQRELGYRGSDADGIPGMTSLRKLGARHGFSVKA